MSEPLKVSTAFTGFLDAEDVPDGKDVPVIIEGVRYPNEKDKGSDGKMMDKPIVKIKNIKKEWVMNKTNAKMIRRQHGDDMTKWVGKKIVIHRDVCNAFGKRNTPCIRVRGESL